MPYTLDNLPTVLQEIFRYETIADLSGATHPLHSNVSCWEAVRLYTLVRNLRPEATIEIGFAQGISTLAILKALDDNQRGSHYVIDPFQSNAWNNLGIQMVEKAKLSNRLNFYEKLPEEIIPHLRTFEFGFIDSSHLFDLTLLDFVLIDKKLSISGIIGLHDLWMPSLKALYRYIISNRAFEPYNDTTQQERAKEFIMNVVLKLLPLNVSTKRRLYLDTAVSQMVFLKKVDDDHRDWRFHKSF